ncbi:gas vesicle protein [Streptomyces litmocidini]|uniref:gas vesicle protein n=1 Tax=Streptomyces litmocidini TaxID=67318 RepID=UPI00167CD3A2|nr:gas vesicle protein [Streptomyces litmocidini]
MAGYPPSSASSLADILERVLDKGIVIAGDIRINLLDIELLTIKLRILIASVDKAKEMGIDWWEHDPSLSSRHDRFRRDSSRVDSSHRDSSPLDSSRQDDVASLAAENRRLREEIARMRREGLTTGSGPAPDAIGREEAEEEAEDEARPARRTTKRRTGT